MASNEKTGNKPGKIASKVLRTSKNKNLQTLAGSDLTQRPDRKKKKK